MSNCNLYLKPLPEDITEEKVRKEFSEYGEITSIKIEHKNNNHFGYVLFADYFSAQKAMINTNSQNIWGTNLQVDYYETKSNRKQ